MHTLKSLTCAAALMLSAFGMAAPAAAQPQAAAPALYMVRDADSTLYLYGTIHLRKPGEPWGGAHVDAALAASQEIWTEIEISPAVDAQAQQLALQYGMAPADRPLSSWLEPADRQRLTALAAGMGVPADNLDRLRPWLASLTLTIVPMIRAGYDPQAGVDRAIDAWGDANGRTMRSFETAEQQIRMFADMSDAGQREMLLSTIEESEKGLAVIDELIAAWEAGDMDAIERVALVESREKYPDMHEVIFTRRNNAWVEVLAQELAGSGVDFVAVGAGHLPGQEGLIAQLQARGFRVERVTAGR